MAQKVVTNVTSINDGVMPVNPEVTIKLKKWDRIEVLLNDNEEEFRKEPFIARLPNESASAFERRKSSYHISFINNDVDLVSAAVDQVFRNEINLSFDKDNSLLKDFSQNCTLGNEPYSFERYIRDFIAIGLRGYGTTVTVIDKPDKHFPDRASERASGLPYLNNIKPQNILNWEIDSGELIWFSYKRMYAPPWRDPIRTKPPKVEQQIVIVDREKWVIKNAEGQIVSIKKHNWGIVPVVVQSSFLSSPNALVGTAANEQTSRMLISFNYMLNVAKYEIDKHGASLMAMPESARSGQTVKQLDNGDPYLKAQGDSNLIMTDGDEKPEFIVKDLAIEDIMTMAEYYATAAVENERDLKSIVKKGDSGTTAQSGLAKMMDREPLEVNLISLATDCEIYSDKVFNIVATILKVENDATLTFDKTYDLKPFANKLEEIEKAIKVNLESVMPTGLKEMYKDLRFDITRDEDLREQMEKEVDEADIVEDTLFSDVDKNVNVDIDSSKDVEDISSAESE